MQARLGPRLKTLTAVAGGTERGNRVGRATGTKLEGARERTEEGWIGCGVARDAPRHNGGKLIAEIWVQCKRVARLGVDWGFMKKATTLRRSHKSAISSGTLSRRPRGRAERAERAQPAPNYLVSSYVAHRCHRRPIRRTRRVRHFERPVIFKPFTGRQLDLGEIFGEASGKPYLAGRGEQPISLCPPTIGRFFCRTPRSCNVEGKYKFLFSRESNVTCNIPYTERAKILL